MIETILTKFGWLIAGAIAAVVWLVRLEAVALSNRREIARLWAQRKEDLESSKEHREATNKMLSEIRDDVKSLIRGD